MDIHGHAQQIAETIYHTYYRQLSAFGTEKCDIVSELYLHFLETVLPSLDTKDENSYRSYIYTAMENKLKDILTEKHQEYKIINTEIAMSGDTPKPTIEELDIDDVLSKLNNLADRVDKLHKILELKPSGRLLKDIHNLINTPKSDLDDLLKEEMAELERNLISIGISPARGIRSRGFQTHDITKYIKDCAKDGITDPKLIKRKRLLEGLYSQDKPIRAVLHKIGYTMKGKK